MTDPIPNSLTKAMEEILEEESLRGNNVSTVDYVEYVAIYQDEDLNRYTDTWDVSPELPESKTIHFLEQKADKESREILWVAKASKTVFHDQDTDTFNTVYNSQFEKVDIYAV